MNRVAIGRGVLLALSALVTAGWLAALWIVPQAAPWAQPPERTIITVSGQFVSPTDQAASSAYDFRTDQDEWLSLVCEPNDFRTGHSLRQTCLAQEGTLPNFAGRPVIIRYFQTEWRTVLGPRPDLVLLEIQADGAPLISRSDREAWIQAEARKAATAYPLLWGFTAAIGGWLAAPWMLRRGGQERPTPPTRGKAARAFGRRA